MKLIYTSPNQILVENAKNVLENAGLTVVMKNQYLSSGFGELSGIATWPEVWVLDDTEYEHAMKLVEPLLSPDSQEDWVCENCKELNDPSFDACWNCQREKR